MTNAEKFGLWNFEIISVINDHMKLVRNKTSNMQMIHLVMPGDMFEVMQKLCNVSNPNVMQVYDVVRNSNLCFCLCEYVDGITLEKYVEYCGKPSEKDAKKIMIDICNGLESLHKVGVIHRDINPSNIMVTKNRHIKIIDFDIIRSHKDNQQKDTTILGTPGYTSPEQFGFDQTDASADIYSCGVLLNYILTGALPDEIRYSGPLRDVIERCTEIDKAKRFESVSELRSALKKRHYRYGRFLPLPGFRSDKFLPKLLTTAFLVAYVFFLSLVVISCFKTDNSTASIYVTQRKEDPFFIFVIFGFWSLFPYLLWGDFGRMSELICKRNPKSGKSILVLLGFLSIIIGFVILAISQ